MVEQAEAVQIDPKPPAKNGEVRSSLHVLSFDEIIAQETARTFPVVVEEWGGTLMCRGITKQQQSDLRNAARIAGEVDEALVAKGLFRMGVVEPEFTEEQVNALWEQQAGVIDGILLQILHASGMDTDSLNRWQRMFRSGS